MEFEQLRELDAIARTGSFSAAAAELRASQPAISRSMRALERELGCELFTRTRNRAELNEAGRLAVQHARSVLAEERRMRDAFDELSRRQRTIQVASVAPAPVWRLTELVVARLPGTILTSEVVADEREVERRLFHRSADVAITNRPLGLPTIVSAPLMTENLFAYVPATDELAERESVSFAELNGRTFLMNAVVGFWGDVVRAALPDSRIIEQTDAHVLAHLIATSDTFGFTTDAAEFAPTEMERGVRVRVPIRDASAHATFFAICLADAPRAVRAIVTALKDIGDATLD